jgi:beta-phosphoglucomutase-like phosphatase (HAD superfamily)
MAGRKALLFDIDGTLADTDALHLQAFNQVFGPRGHVFDHARFSKELQGFSNMSIGERFLADEPPTRRAAIMAEKEAASRKLVSGQIQPLWRSVRLGCRHCDDRNTEQPSPCGHGGRGRIHVGQKL